MRDAITAMARQLRSRGESGSWRSLVGDTEGSEEGVTGDMAGNDSVVRASAAVRDGCLPEVQV
jgi:hypothetical protein